MIRRILVHAFTLSCLHQIIFTLELGGLTIFMKPKGLEEAIVNQKMDDLNLKFQFESSLLKTAEIKSLFTGDEVQVTREVENKIKLKFLHPTALVQVESSILAFLQDRTSDLVAITFDYITIVLDISKKNKKLVSSIDVYVNKIDDDSVTKSPSKRLIYSLLSKDGLNPVLNSEASLQMMGEKLSSKLYGDNIKELGNGLFVNLSVIQRLKLISMSKNTRFEISYACDGTFFNKDSVMKSISESQYRSFSLPDHSKDISLVVSEHSLESALQSRLELEGGLNYTSQESGSIVSINSIPSKPLKVTITPQGIVLSKTLHVQIFVNSIERKSEIETKSKVIPKFQGNLLVLQIEDIEYDENAINNLVRIPFLNPSKLVNSLIKSNLKKSVKSPAVDMQSIEMSATKGRFKLQDRQLELVKGFVVVFYKVQRNEVIPN